MLKVSPLNLPLLKVGRFSELAKSVKEYCEGRSYKVYVTLLHIWMYTSFIIFKIKGHDVNT